MNKKIALFMLSIMLLTNIAAVKAELALPDLVIDQVQVSDQGGQPYIKFIISNAGAAIQSGQVISVKAEDLETGEIYISEYSNGLSTSTEILSFKRLETKNQADYKLRTTIDFMNVISESNETNNILDQPLSFDAPSNKPDLVVKDIYFYPNNPIKGQKFTGELRVKIGNGWTSALIVDPAECLYKITTKIISSSPVSDMLGNDRANVDLFACGPTIGVDGTVDVAYGLNQAVFNSNISISTIIDSASRIDETDKNNNILEKTIVLGLSANNSKFPGFGIEPSKKVYQSNEDLAIKLRRMDGQATPYAINLWAQKVVPSGTSQKYQIYANVPVGDSYLATMDIDKLDVFTKGGNGNYILLTCPTTGCTMETSNSVPINIEGFQESKPIIEPISEPAKPTSDDQLASINDSAKNLNNGKISQLLTQIKQLRNELREQAAELKYLKMFASEMKALSANMQSAIKTFITYGVDDNTQKLGEGERAAVISSYEAAFDKFPTTEAELADAIKIANGRFPAITNSAAEKRGAEQFFKIYSRVPDMNDAKDVAAVKVMAYGLRQKAQNRNMNSEKSGIKTFTHIFGSVPKSTQDWNAMQAITYSGAVKKVDSDKDGLADETEVKLGTNPNNPDTDNDGYKDGLEVLKGYSPLKK